MFDLLLFMTTSGGLITFSFARLIYIYIYIFAVELVIVTVVAWLIVAGKTHQK